ncbi:hypothetical protein [Candidatus Puniceispirillum marinum]|uniref:Scaffolding protein n=1 Tax=Puniceispirillum marinum (strain IMCC1322) TaxID=488538 RepID=D5BQB9_PUNMI|nr:hypothetical protein [Candidatus Puniceispirillum marinum]ADE38617.1 hypothetical protein SAR116_0374 [Candidatus Puniceispirillum marinum IMCC1322]
MNDVQNNTSTEPVILTMDNVEDAILARWDDAEKLSEDSEEATSEVEEETIDDEGEEEATAEETDETDEDPENDDQTEDEEDTDEADYDDYVIDEDAEIEILVEGEVQRASIKSLKRLYGVEASLTRKSQEVASKRKEADDAISKSQVFFDQMLKKAQDRYKPYADVDMLVASKSMSTEDFAQLRKEATEAFQDLQFLNEEADTYFGELQKQQQAAVNEAAKECVKVLQDQIPDWSNEMYSDIRQYAISQGLPEDNVNQIVDPNVIMILNKSRLFDQGKKVATVKKKTAQKKVLRSKKSPPNEAIRRKANLAKQQEALRSSRDTDDIANVILSRWEAT